MSKTSISYHWRTVTREASGEVVHIDQTDDMPTGKLTKNQALVLTCEITGNDGSYYVMFAEVTKGELPAMFSDHNGQEVRPVPQRFIDMVAGA